CPPGVAEVVNWALCPADLDEAEIGGVEEVHVPHHPTFAAGCSPDSAASLAHSATRISPSVIFSMRSAMSTDTRLHRPLSSSDHAGCDMPARVEACRCESPWDSRHDARRS